MRRIILNQSQKLTFSPLSIFSTSFSSSSRNFPVWIPPLLSSTTSHKCSHSHHHDSCSHPIHSNSHSISTFSNKINQGVNVSSKTPTSSSTIVRNKSFQPYRPATPGVNTSQGALKELFANNREWSRQQIARDKDFFSRLVAVQRPKYLWIGCSDSRVPANQIVGLLPGELFVHRNVGGLILHTDWNCLSVVQFAVEYLKVEHILICGHYACGGVAAAMDGRQYGLIDHWLRHIKDLYERNIDEFKGLDQPSKVNLLCEISVRQQVKNLCQTTIVRNAWKRQQRLGVHGMIYDLKDGILRDLEVYVDGVNRIAP